MSDTHEVHAVTVIEHSPSSTMSPVVAGVMRKLNDNPDPATLRELLAVQREWEAGEARKAYAMALVGLKRDLPAVIARDKSVSFGTTKYTHTSLGAAMEAVTGHLVNHGFAHSWKPSTSGGDVTVTCRLTHAAGHTEEVSLTAPPDKAGSKSPQQGIMSTVTLLERYTLLSMLGIATSDMKDPEPVAASPDAVDSAKNLAAVGWIKGKGKTREDAEKFLDRKVAQWTGADLTRLKTWAVAPAAPEPGSGG